MTIPIGEDLVLAIETIFTDSLFTERFIKFKVLFIQYIFYRFSFYRAIFSIEVPIYSFCLSEKGKIYLYDIIFKRFQNLFAKIRLFGGGACDI